jgi:hypothetical protein
MLRALVPVLLAVGVLSGAGWAQARTSTWRQAELPTGFQLDLSTGVVTDSRAGVQAVLSWEDGRLRSDAALALWPSQPEGPANTVRRGEGREVQAPVVRRGDELLFDLGSAGWGYLRVLAVKPELVSLEWAHALARHTRMERDPHGLRVRAGQESVALDWDAPPGAVYRVERRVVDAHDFRPLARVVGDRWLDTEPPDGLLEYRVSRFDSPQAFGAGRRTVRAVLSEEEPFELSRGQRLDLLSGESGGPAADLEVVHFTNQSVSLRPLDGTRIYPLPQTGAVPWTLPPVDGARYVDQVRTVPINAVLAAHLREGIYARLVFEAQDGRVLLRRQVEPEGGRVLPIAPRAGRAGWEQGRVTFVLEQLGAQVPPANSVRVVLEVERAFRSGAWDELMVGAPGVRELVARLPRTPGAPPIVRLRARHALAGGPTSAPGTALVLLLGDPEDAQQVEAWLDGAFDDLLHSDFERRLAAQGVITRLGRRAAPRLERALRSSDPELSAAAREILVSAAVADGGHVELLLRARAIAEGVDSPAPEGLFEANPARRAWALLRSPPSPALDEWTHLAALADPDGGVAGLARGLERSPAVPSKPPAPGVPFSLIPPADRPVPLEFDWRGLVYQLSPLETARQARAALDLARPDTAALLLRIAGEIELPGGAPRRWSDRGDLVERIELALRLVQRAGPDDHDLLVAAGSLLDSEAALVLAARDSLARRLSFPVPPSFQRPVVRLSSGTYEELASVVSNLVAEDAGYLDLVLPAGEYRAPPGSPWLDLSLTGLRVIGEGDVRLLCGVRIEQARDVVLEGLTVENSAGSALVVTRAGVLARSCRFAGVQTTLMVNQGSLDLEQVECAPLQERDAGWCVRVLGRGRLAARACLFTGGTLAGGEGGSIVLDRCVVDSGGRGVIQGRRGDEVVLLDCLLRGEGRGVTAVEYGFAVGVMFDTAREPVDPASGLRVCPLGYGRSERTPLLDPRVLLASPVFGR